MRGALEDRPRHVVATIAGEHPGALAQHMDGGGGSGRVYALLPAVGGADATATLAAARRVAARLQRHGTVGVSSFYGDVADLGRAIQEAELVLDVLRRSDVPIDEDIGTGTYRLLFRVLASHPEEVRSFYEDTVAPLVAYDAQYSTDLVGTLSAYLERNCNMNATASAIYAHRHTVAYRLERVKELTGLDPLLSEDRERPGPGAEGLPDHRAALASVTESLSRHPGLGVSDDDWTDAGRGGGPDARPGGSGRGGTDRGHRSRGLPARDGDRGPGAGQGRRRHRLRARRRGPHRRRPGHDRLQGDGTCPAGAVRPDECDDDDDRSGEEDVLRGGDGDDTLLGGRGNDFIDGGAGIDSLSGDAGNDEIDAGADGDESTAARAWTASTAGDGDDWIATGPGTDRIEGGAGADLIATETGNDRINGGAGNDEISSGSGNDRIDPGKGRDLVEAGAGNDTIDARDGQRDVIRCGSGRDTVKADARDTLSGCERINGRSRA